MTAPAVDRGAFAGWSIDATPSAQRTLERMARFCRQAMRNPAIVRYANEIIAADRPRDLAAQIATIRLFLESWFHFVDNPIGVQRIRTPADMIADIESARGYVMGACDDAAVLAATLGMANGLEARFRAVAFGSSSAPDPSATLTHVIADLYDGAEWRALDVTKPLDLLRPPVIVRTLTLLV